MRDAVIVEVEVLVRMVREKSIAVWDGVKIDKGNKREAWAWLPISQIQGTVPDVSAKPQRIAIPEWLADKAGLDGEPLE